jgi:CubicO group peptidase (beta-lactamase class C family)
LWYAEPNVIALQWLLEQTAKRRILDILETDLWQRIGAEYRINAIVDGLGTPAFGTGISIATRDIGRIGQLLLNRGHLNGVEIVRESSIADILETRNVNAINDASNLSALQTYRPGYRSLFWTWPATGGRLPLLSAMGFCGQHCVVDYHNQNVIVKLSSDPDFSHLAEDVKAIQSLSAVLT